MIEISSEDLLPGVESNLAWRWTRASHLLLPEDEKKQIFSLSSSAALRAHAMASRLAKATAQDEKRLDVSSAPSGRVSMWLASLPVEQGALVVASWSSEVGIRVPWDLLVERWSVFCYPSSDDVDVFPLGCSWLLSYDHGDSFMWRTWRAS